MNDRESVLISFSNSTYSEIHILEGFIEELFDKREALLTHDCFVSHNMFCVHKSDGGYSPRIEIVQLNVDKHVLVGKVIVVKKEEDGIVYKQIEELVAPIEKGLDMFDYLMAVFKRYG
ncbi:hypothetical protein ONV78_30300 [Hahella sp. CR1]|uniref:hypothetical protein n=1 Tax=Hahella sp. CR1 TaxID=2992807 RepID=UPI00244256F0|nr:hypothetical protein [Hahella sp. CR1]MDG9672064.1 hypothetical protein [Hahella sp. CR1]